MPDYELMELVLFAASPRRDAKPLAKTLIDRFARLPMRWPLHMIGCSKSAASATRWSSDPMHQPIILQRDFEIQGGVIDVIPGVGDT